MSFNNDSNKIQHNNSPSKIPLQMNQNQQKSFVKEEHKIDEMVYSYKDSQKDMDTEDLSLRRNSSLSSNLTNNKLMYSNERESKNPHIISS